MTHPFIPRHLDGILQQRGYVSVRQIEEAGPLDEFALGQALLSQGAITGRQLAEAWAERFNLDHLALDDFVVSPELFRLIPVADCYQHTLLPYRRAGEVLEVVVADPRDLALAPRLEAQLGLRVKLLLSSREAIETALKRSQGESALLQDLTQDFRLMVVRQREDGAEQLISLDAMDDGAGPVVKLVNTLLAAALTKRASDVHIETHEQAITVKYRIDGVLYPATEMLDKRHHSALVSQSRPNRPRTDRVRPHPLFRPSTPSAQVVFTA